jgi:hypothetical protein
MHDASQSRGQVGHSISRPVRHILSEKFTMLCYYFMILLKRNVYKNVLERGLQKEMRKALTEIY